jgi:hypothetical protein
LIAAAFAEIGRLANLNGRRLDRAYAAYRARWIPILHGSPMLTAKMAPRKVRRQIARESGLPWRPVYGYRGGGNNA